ncbi:MAG: hypothetical protein M1819_003149 [Sarea resinae]|nr:MAG: hypothetical protein M1819_003149 [Sarea resinae]
MTDISPVLNEALKRHDAPPIVRPTGRLPNVDEFLKEAYRIIDSSAPIPSRDKERKYFTDADRDRIDAESKQLLRELNGAIRNLADAEKLRQDTEATLVQRKRANNGFGLLGRWAAGGMGHGKTPQEELEDARASGIKVHRESVLWYLRRKLEECGEIQRSMMETRLTREVEKSKSVLYKTRGIRGMSGTEAEEAGELPRSMANSTTGYVGGRAVQMDEVEKREVEQQLSPEQLQLFAQENQDMLKHYEDTLDQVRTAERSLIEISELQTTLASNLATQSVHIDQLVAESVVTSENIGGGNKELKKASERKSTARLVFYTTCGFSLFLVIWDLII